MFFRVLFILACFVITFGSVGCVYHIDCTRTDYVQKSGVPGEIFEVAEDSSLLKDFYLGTRLILPKGKCPDGDFKSHMTLFEV